MVREIAHVLVKGNPLNSFCPVQTVIWSQTSGFTRKNVLYRDEDTTHLIFDYRV